MKVRIVSDGETRGTRLYAEDGTELTGAISAITWSHEGGDMPKARVELCLVPFEANCEACMMGPDGREIRRIEYVDGSVDVFPQGPRE